MTFFGVWWRDALHRLALRYCEGLFEYSRSLWVMQYEVNDFQGGWWPKVELYTTEAAALRDFLKKSKAGGHRSIRVNRVPVGAGVEAFRYSEVVIREPST